MAEPTEQKSTNAPAHEPETGPQVEITPRQTRRNVRIGELVTQRYDLIGAQKGAVRWSHSTDTGDSSGRGKSSEIVYQVPTVGKHELRAVAHVADKKSRTSARVVAPVVELAAPRVQATIWNMSSTSQRGTVPVVDEIQPDEILIVEGQVENVDDGFATAANATFYGAGFKVLEVEYSSDNKFVAKLKPTSEGHFRGSLKVVPLGVASTYAEGATLALTVKPPTTNEQGRGRPLDASDAIDHVIDAVDEYYSARLTGVQMLLAQISVEDPPAADPMIIRLLNGAIAIALSAATAGIGVAIGAAVVGSAREAMQEIVKVAAESTLAAGTEFAVGELIASAKPKKNGENGTPSSELRLSIEAMFVDSQKSAIDKLRANAMSNIRTGMRTLVPKLEAESSGSGYRAAVLYARELSASAAAAKVDQFRRSLQGWAVLMARSSLGRTELQDGTAGGTDLAKETSATLANMGAAPGGNTEGVLNLRLEPQSDKAGSYKVSRAFITGFTNNAIVENFKDMPIGSLQIPITAQYSEDDARGFMIGRNENKEYFADDAGGVLMRRAAGMFPTAIDVARAVFEQDLATTKVKPERA